MAKEQKTPKELAKMISDELGDPNIGIVMHPAEGLGWNADALNTDDAAIVTSVEQIVQKLRARYDLKK